MSDSLKGLLDAATPALEAQVKKLANDYLDEAGKTLEGLTGPVKDAVGGHLAKAADYRLKAIQQGDEETRRAYVEGAADELASAETVLKSEALAVTNEQAATFIAGFSSVLSAVGSVAKGLISAIASGIASGVVSGVVGGDGSPDLSSIFPGA